MSNNNSIESITISLGDIDVGPVQQEFDFDFDITETITLSDTYVPVTNGMTMASNTITVGGASTMIGAGGSSGYTYHNGTSSIDWLASASISADPSLKGSTLKVNGNAEIDGELTVKGVKLSERLNKIDERLGILHPNPELEERWENLRGLREAYLELEKEIIEKEKMWAILKK